MDLAINNVIDLCNFVGKMVCVCVCVCARVWVYLELLSHFLPIKINLTNIVPILIKIVDFKNLAWATSFATRASRKFIYLPYRASWEKSYCHTLHTHHAQSSGAVWMPRWLYRAPIPNISNKPTVSVDVKQDSTNLNLLPPPPPWKWRSLSSKFNQMKLVTQFMEEDKWPQSLN